MNDAGPMKYTLGQAAVVTGKAKGTISNAIKNGRISAEKNEDGSYSIDASELSRRFPLINLNSNDNLANERSATPNNTSVLEREIEFLKQRLADAEVSAAKAEQDRDRWHEQARDAMLRLEAPKPKGWLARLFGS